ncbi:DUF2079 domain-containing protein [Gimesia algae]|uniref:DUF2079 domain-containing protein n=1 Tax=Gimesia algae TaxID=2527971 RepID=A0A517VGE6_9PLAN|nr:DUF2079 domain-containing protein [Gimesia algae]QDT92098.1 hypothetical protein Pan161_37630 [Gimesia algae]
MNQRPATKSSIDSRQLTFALLCILLGSGSVTLALQTIFGTQDIATLYVSVPLWQSLLQSWSGKIDLASQTAIIPFFPLLLYLLISACGFWFAGALLISKIHGQPLTTALTDWGHRGFRWWLLPAAWEILRITTFILGWNSAEGLLLATSQFWFAISIAGWMATFASMIIPLQHNDPNRDPALQSKVSIPFTAWLMMGIFTFIFTWMNWQLYNGLLIPHGDSAMYEEHLWNLSHGKGFRSYLDQGLFWGEHIQFIHLFLLPLYLIWPSHLTLELCETVALAAGAIPLYRMAVRHSSSTTAGKAMVAAYLCYFPLQFLDIAIDLKTFRPISFGVPVLLFALEALELKRWKTAAILLMLTLTAKEDFAIILGPLGLWIAWQQWCERKQLPDESKQSLLRTVGPGTVVSVFAVLYLLFVVKYAIPWFRSGAQVHYVGYFSNFGSTLGEVIKNILFNPGLLLGELFRPDTLIYFLALLVPLGLLPLLSPSRILVALPLFSLLCLNEIAHDPRHHFHAPIVPILCWATACAMGNIPKLLERHAPRFKKSPTSGQNFVIHFLWSSSLATAVFFSISPLGLVFWDSGSNWYWKRLYVPSERAEQFPKILAQIPPDSRVASTDFVHPRFTHFDRSYDYSNYLRKVNEYQSGVPADTDFIVIDTQHPYSQIKTPDQIPEYHDHPGHWELLPDQTEGYFIILKRKPESPSSQNQPPVRP